jgi:hypothetical protein
MDVRHFFASIYRITFRGFRLLQQGHGFSIVSALVLDGRSIYDNFDPFTPTTDPTQIRIWAGAGQRRVCSFFKPNERLEP